MKFAAYDAVGTWLFDIVAPSYEEALKRAHAQSSNAVTVRLVSDNAPGYR